MRTIRPRLVNTCVDSSLTTRSARHAVARAPMSSPTKTASTSRRPLGWSIDIRPGGIVTGSLVLRSGHVGARFHLARYDFAVPAGLVSDAPQSQPIRLWPQTCDRQQRVRRNRTQLGSRSPIARVPRPAPTRLSGEIAHTLALCGRGFRTFPGAREPPQTKRRRRRSTRTPSASISIGSAGASGRPSGPLSVVRADVTIGSRPIWGDATRTTCRDCTRRHVGRR